MTKGPLYHEIWAKLVVKLFKIAMILNYRTKTYTSFVLLFTLRTDF